MEYFEEEVIVVNEKELEDWNCHETELTAGLALTEHVITMSFPVMALWVDCRVNVGKPTDKAQNVKSYIDTQINFEFLQKSYCYTCK